MSGLHAWKKERQAQEKGQPYQVGQSEDRQIAGGSGSIGAKVQLEGYQAGQGGNGGSQPADIHPHQQSGPVLCEAGEQHRRRYIANHLADQNGTA